MTQRQRDTFEFSGDSEWAVWRRGVLCGICWPDSGWKEEAEVEAIGLAVEVVTRGNDSRVKVTPVCKTCAEGTPTHIGQTIHSKTIVMFEQLVPSCDLCESPTTETHRWAALVGHNGGYEMWVCATCVSENGEYTEDN